jgi:hypothetical protein
MSPGRQSATFTLEPHPDVISSTQWTVYSPRATRSAKALSVEQTNGILAAMQHIPAQYLMALTRLSEDQLSGLSSRTNSNQHSAGERRVIQKSIS